MAFTYRQHGDRRQECKAQMDNIIGPRWRSDEAYINHDVKIWDSWDRYPIYARIQEYEFAGNFTEKKGKVDWMEAKSRCAKKKKNSRRK